ncbi:MAG: hypothetical protein JWL76_40 [Thermoleophilia bacterium]|nr:hypothetical protein [Thermoleophilia bacterium]
MQISSLVQPLASAPTASPQPPTAGLLKLVYGDWFRQLGAIDGGRPMSSDALELRFETNRDAVLASAALSDAIDGVRVLVRRQDGSAPAGVEVSAGEVAGFVARIRDLVKVEPRRIPDAAFVVTAARPDDNARLDHLLRDEIAGLPVKWQTAAPSA